MLRERLPGQTLICSDRFRLVGGVPLFVLFDVPWTTEIVIPPACSGRAKLDEPISQNEEQNKPRDRNGGDNFSCS